MHHAHQCWTLTLQDPALQMVAAVEIVATLQEILLAEVRKTGEARDAGIILALQITIDAFPGDVDYPLIMQFKLGLAV